jgi:hypothetical protein
VTRRRRKSSRSASAAAPLQFSLQLAGWVLTVAFGSSLAVSVVQSKFNDLQSRCGSIMEDFYKKGGAAGGGGGGMPDFGGADMPSGGGQPGAAAGPKVEEVD